MLLNAVLLYEFDIMTVLWSKFRTLNDIFPRVSKLWPRMEYLCKNLELNRTKFEWLVIVSDVLVY